MNQQHSAKQPFFFPFYSLTSTYFSSFKFFFFILSILQYFVLFLPFEANLISDALFDSELFIDVFSRNSIADLTNFLTSPPSIVQFYLESMGELYNKSV